MNRTAGIENSENRAVQDDGQNIGEWHRMNSPQFRSHEPIREPSVRGYTPWGCAWRLAVAVLVVYVLLTAALVLTGAGH